MIKSIRRLAKQISGLVGSAHTGAYAAQSAYFFVLSLIPMLLLLLTMIQYTPVTKADVLEAVVIVFPKSVTSFVVTIVNQVYNQSRAIIPVTAVAALWSASRGVLSMTRGLNCVYENNETRHYLLIRVRSTFYTLLFIVIIVFSLVLSVFGNSLSIFINNHAVWLSKVMDQLLQLRAVLTIPVLIAFSMLVYKVIPNHKAKFWQQLPGAIFTSFGWMLASYIFSIYLDVYKGFSNMYGSLATVVLIMLWLYFCMYAMLLGGIINSLYQAKES